MNDVFGLYSRQDTSINLKCQIFVIDRTGGSSINQGYV